MKKKRGSKECKICLKELSCKSSLKWHIRLVHENYRPVNCELCSSSFSSKTAVKSHIESTHFKLRPYKCSICLAAFITKTGLNNHLKVVHDQNPIRCDLCPVRFPHKSAMEIHFKAVHRKEKPFKCDLCPASFFSFWSLRPHIEAVHLKQRPFNCELCSKTFANSSSMNAHVKRTHDKLRPLHCKLCSAKFFNQPQARTHMKIVHEKIREFQCKLCPKNFAQKNELTLHTIASHDKIRSFKCDSCPLTFLRRQTMLVHHRNIHEDQSPAKCKYCSKIFPSKKHVSDHFKLVHEKPRPFCCTLCAKKFSTNDHLRTHVQSVHKKIRPYKCRFCPASFSQSSSVKVHMKGVHKVSCPFACDMCSSTFATIPELKTHVSNVHQEPRKEPTLPEISQSSSVKVHMKGVHKVSCPFACDMCSSTFATIPELKTHVSNVHQEPRKEPSLPENRNKIMYKSEINDDVYSGIGNRFHCAHCDFSSTRKTILTHHILQKHVLLVKIEEKERDIRPDRKIEVENRPADITGVDDNSFFPGLNTIKMEPADEGDAVSNDPENSVASHEETLTPDTKTFRLSTSSLSVSDNVNAHHEKFNEFNSILRDRQTCKVCNETIKKINFHEKFQCPKCELAFCSSRKANSHYLTTHDQCKLRLFSKTNCPLKFHAVVCLKKWNRVLPIFIKTEKVD